MPHPQRFSGESVVSWSDLDITISVPWYLGLMFRTRKADGVLMEATAGMSSRLHLQVSENPARALRGGAPETLRRHPGSTPAAPSAVHSLRLPGGLRVKGRPAPAFPSGS